ncbi:unnamed protein product [Mycena citricolor]|uniref:NAD(P)-binding protein n=1 Tax=Mycena citricolor TaxID=2018698 RepID=A0AAD2HXN6_9AGAR|nr:unnamed protein product [Mycena citricolor]
MGIVASTLTQMYPPKPKFSVDQIPDLTGQVLIVTGANAGIGKETTKALLSHNAKVYMAARSEEKVKAAIEELKTATGKEAFFLQLDLSDLHSIKRAVEEFTSKETQLHVLFNNAWVFAHLHSPVIVDPLLAVSWYGWIRICIMIVHIDLLVRTRPTSCLQHRDTIYKLAPMFLVNGRTSHFYLTKLLLPTLISTAAEAGKPVRVVNTSSSTSEFAGGKLRYEAFTEGPARQRMGMSSMYSQSKFGNVLFSNELARLYGDKGIVSTSLNPGNLRTELLRHTPSVQAKIIDFLFLYPAPYGALTQLWAGTSEQGASMNGKARNSSYYLIPWARIGNTPKGGNDLEAQKALWEWAEKQISAIQ